jgi:hypothetical protein
MSYATGCCCDCDDYGLLFLELKLLGYEPVVPTPTLDFYFRTFKGYVDDPTGGLRYQSRPIGEEIWETNKIATHHADTINWPGNLDDLENFPYKYLLKGTLVLPSKFQGLPLDNSKLYNYGWLLKNNISNYNTMYGCAAPLTTPSGVLTELNSLSCGVEDDIDLSPAIGNYNSQKHTFNMSVQYTDKLPAKIVNSPNSENEIFYSVSGTPVIDNTIKTTTHKGENEEPIYGEWGCSKKNCKDKCVEESRSVIAPGASTKTTRNLGWYQNGKTTRILIYRVHPALVDVSGNQTVVPHILNRLPDGVQYLTTTVRKQPPKEEKMECPVEGFPVKSYCVRSSLCSFKKECPGSGAMTTKYEEHTGESTIETRRINPDTGKPWDPDDPNNPNNGSKCNAWVFIQYKDTNNIRRRKNAAYPDTRGGQWVCPCGKPDCTNSETVWCPGYAYLRGTFQEDLSYVSSESISYFRVDDKKDVGVAILNAISLLNPGTSGDVNCTIPPGQAGVVCVTNIRQIQNITVIDGTCPISTRTFNATLVSTRGAKNNCWVYDDACYTTANSIGCDCKCTNPRNQPGDCWESVNEYTVRKCCPRFDFGCDRSCGDFDDPPQTSNFTRTVPLECSPCGDDGGGDCPITEIVNPPHIIKWGDCFDQSVYIENPVLNKYTDLNDYLILLFQKEAEKRNIAFNPANIYFGQPDTYWYDAGSSSFTLDAINICRSEPSTLQIPCSKEKNPSLLQLQNRCPVFNTVSLSNKDNIYSSRFIRQNIV